MIIFKNYEGCSYQPRAGSFTASGSSCQNGAGLFAKQDTITATQVAETLGLSERMARNLMLGWVGDGWLLAADDSRRKRAYALSAIYRQYIGSLSARPFGKTG